MTSVAPGRCLMCGTAVKPSAGARLVNCPSCGLTLVVMPGREDLAPMVAPRLGRDACFAALATERRLPEAEGATVVRQARLLLVPFWRHVDESKRSVARRGTVVSAADLLPVGLPTQTASHPSVRGLVVEEHTRTGDLMGRLPDDQLAIEAHAVSVTRAPGGGPASDAPPSPGDPDGAGWRLVYHPVWAFHYVVYDKEHLHVVDAVSGLPIGPAHRPRLGRVGVATGAAMLVLFAAGLPWLAGWAALPAWLGGLVVSRAVMRAER